MWYETLNEKPLWNNFQNISAIPRESGNEEGVRRYLIAWAKEHGIEAITDKVGNVIMKKPATKGMEDKAPVLLQGHMDMVCVKTNESKHDFTKDGIEIVLDNGTIHAKDTSLGADNGIAIAMIMALFTDDTLVHGPLEALFTVSEETGLTGACGLEGAYIKSRYLINLDSEEEGIIYIGCAGGIEVYAQKAAKYEVVEADSRLYTLSITGLLGGHSGGEIHKQRANAIKLAARILHRIDDIQLVDISGGTKRNVIPSFCTAKFVAPAKRDEVIRDIVKNAAAEIKAEYAIQDPDIDIELESDACTLDVAIEKKLTRRWINALYLAHHGVLTNSLAIPGIVETSANLAVVGIDNNENLYSATYVRSSVDSAQNELAYTVAAAFETAKAEITYSNSHPAWTPNASSAFTKMVAKAYEDYAGKPPVITAIHAGLECGIINSKVTGMDAVSIGPDIFDVHSTNEHADVASTERMLCFLRHLLSTL